MDPLSRLIRGGSAESGQEAVLSRIAEVEQQHHRVEDRVNALIAVFDSAIKSSLRSARSAQALRSWTFEARMPNTSFQQVGLPARDTNGVWHRWVVASHALVGTLAVPRGTQYELTVEVVEFPSKEAEESFYVRGDGLSLPWLEVSGRTFKTLIPDSPRETLMLEIGVSPFAAQGSGGRAFAFSKVSLVAQ